MIHALGRVVEHDPLSRNFVHNAAAKPLVKKTTRWATHAPVLDQKSLGSCTGNAMAGWLNTDYGQQKHRAPQYLVEEDAVQLYSLATTLDNAPGKYPPNDTGSSGNAVAKAARKLGYLSGYTWTFSLNGFLAALQTQPVVVGTAFYAGMEDPNTRGIVRPIGQLEGGHEYLMIGVDYGSAMLEFVNSWSDQWGVRGHAYISITDFGRLLTDRNMPGDVTAPTLK
jgi:hypothetical protein